MGREQELRESARDGNLAKLEALLAGKKSSIMSSLRRGLNINCQDENGNTALHLAALNGKSKAASLLLQNDASANIPDASGNYPLHLAAFNGHHDVIDVLINQGPSRANVLEQNGTLDTALHIASQYGHTQVVKILLEYHADPHMRNKNGESPLDLAAMYGRLSTVQVLVLSDKTLVKDYYKGHSPLHLSARNGHTSVIEALLYAGMSVDVMCDRGTALHEAALFGKIEAVKILLKRGIDVNETNSEGHTVLDLLIDLPSERSQEITALIYEQTQLMMNPTQLRSKSFSITSQTRVGIDTVPDDAERSGDVSRLSSRSASLYQRKPEPDYVLLPGPRISKSYDGLQHSSISPVQEDTATQGDIFNDNFLRQMSPSSPGPSFEEEPKEESVLEQKKPITPNVYEEQFPPQIANNTAAVYDTVPPPRFASGSMTSQSSVDSVPSFPPPSSDEAIKTLQNFMAGDRLPNEAEVADSQGHHSPGVYENFDFRNPSNESHKEDGGVYDNVLIRSTPAQENNDVLDPSTVVANSLPDSLAENMEEQRQFSPVKQIRTRSSVKEGKGSRPSSTLNESYEWSKIDKIFSSFEDLLNCDPLEEKEDSQAEPASVGEWLSSLGLSHYEPSFVGNGYDDVTLLGGNFLDEDDLREIGIQNSDHIKMILKSASSLPSPPQIGIGGNGIPDTVLEWLTMINLADYESKFAINRYFTIDRVRAIWEFELTTVIGIPFIGHRKRMIYSLGRRPQNDREKVSWSEKFAAAEAPRLTKPNSSDDAMNLANQLLKEAEDMAHEFGKRQMGGKGSEPLSPTSPASPTSPTSPKILKYEPSFQWLHKPEKLLYESVAYPTQYLGSHPVMVVRGTESTLEACKKMKSTSQMLQKVPIIHLSISVRGIDFIDAQSNSIISSYDIRYISYCAQDPDDLSVFAYITKDAGNAKHYCHVFKARNVKLADDVVLTIGQAFELAYHQHRMLIKGKKDPKGEPEQPPHQSSNALRDSENKVDDTGEWAPPIPKPFAQTKQSRNKWHPFVLKRTMHMLQTTFTRQNLCSKGKADVEMKQALHLELNSEGR